MLKYLLYQLILLLTLSLLFVQNSLAFRGSDLTELEWNSWPDYCKAGFATSGWRKNTPYSKRVDSNWARKYNTTYSEINGIPGIHHFCVGMTFINRARANPKKKQLLEYAISDIQYSFQRMKPTALKYSTVAAYLGKAYYGIGNRNKAISIWENGIAFKPKSPESYLAYAEALLSEKKYNEALKLLLQFDQVKASPSAEAEYFLGHVYFKLGQYDKARLYADNAFKLGYLLPGLRNRLKKIGK